MTSRAMVAVRIAAPATRVFTAFTAEIGQWWRPHGLFELNGRADGRLAMEAWAGGRVTETYPDGEEFEVGRVRVWEPPERLVLSWRAASFPPDRETQVHVRFEAVAGGTRVVASYSSMIAGPTIAFARSERRSTGVSIQPSFAPK